MVVFSKNGNDPILQTSTSTQDMCTQLQFGHCVQVSLTYVSAWYHCVLEFSENIKAEADDLESKRWRLSETLFCQHISSKLIFCKQDFLSSSGLAVWSEVLMHLSLLEMYWMTWTNLQVRNIDRQMPFCLDLGLEKEPLTLAMQISDFCHHEMIFSCSKKQFSEKKEGNKNKTVVWRKITVSPSCAVIPAKFNWFFQLILKQVFWFVEIENVFGALLELCGVSNKPIQATQITQVWLYLKKKHRISQGKAWLLLTFVRVGTSPLDKYSKTKSYFLPFIVSRDHVNIILYRLSSGIIGSELHNEELLMIAFFLLWGRTVCHIFHVYPPNKLSFAEINWINLVMRRSEFCSWW